MAVKRYLLLLALVSGVACQATATDPAILTLGDQSVRRSDFERHLKALEARGGSALGPEVRQALLEPFLEERVIVLEARARGLLTPDASADQEQRAVRKLLSDEVISRVRVEDAEIEAYYEEHAGELKIPESVTLRQILLPSESEAREVQRKILREPKSFDLLARTRSRSPEASSGGVMGTFPRGQLPPDLETPAFAVPVGGTSDVVQTPLGYHVLKVDARTPARERSLDECRGEIRSRLLRERSDFSVQKFVQGLMARAKVNHEAAQARNSPS